MGIGNTRDVWVYYNTFFDNSGSDLRSVIQLRGNVRAVNDVHIIGNLLVSNQPEYKEGLFYRVREGVPSHFVHDYKLWVAYSSLRVRRR